jgi:hypothetical protein
MRLRAKRNIEEGTGTSGERPRRRSCGRIAGIELPVCRLPHPYEVSRRAAEENRAISAGRFVKNRMLSQREC